MQAPSKRGPAPLIVEFAARLTGAAADRLVHASSVCRALKATQCAEGQSQHTIRLLYRGVASLTPFRPQIIADWSSFESYLAALYVLRWQLSSMVDAIGGDLVSKYDAVREAGPDGLSRLSVTHRALAGTA